MSSRHATSASTNLTYSHQDSHGYLQRRTADAPPPMKRIVIVGGGSSGWMTAMILANALLAKGVEITVLESPAIGIIGVGEGSTPWLRGFFDSLGIEESEWMPACNATYKCGITFDGWCTRPGFESYFHPFASMLDNLTVGMFINNSEARVNGVDAWAHPNRFFISSKLAEQKRAPRPSENFPFDIWYGYHFDAALIGQFLGKKAQERGVKHKSCTVAEVKLAENGDIKSLVTKEGESLEADFFVDCSGFGGLLIQKALKTPYIPYGDNLFNDSAVAMPTPMDERIPSETVSSAMRHGWKWKIPLTNRFGNGYVYSSAHCSADEAERELRESIGMLDSKTEARHLKMKTGRCTRHWNRNCLAVGLSQGFIEPLEATALLFIQRTAALFVEHIAGGDMSEKNKDAFNERLNRQFEGTRDYIVTHYKTNTRTDTDYWRENAANTKISPALLELYALWMSGKGFTEPVGRQLIGQGYPIFSWYCIMAGNGIFPEPGRLRPPKPEEHYEMPEIDNLIERSALNFRDQRELLAAIPPKRKERSLQVYFW
jgi:2-polyprenyl-6-methoxyphenol hydroxylase-like FAD-dependent oxidoreductase